MNKTTLNSQKEKHSMLSLRRATSNSKVLVAVTTQYKRDALAARHVGNHTISYSTALAALPYPNRETRNAAIFLPSCYAVGAKRVLLHKALRVRFSQGKGLIPKPLKSLFYRVTNMQQRS